ncbi:FG-GAP-like repeat-containing protein [Actinoplanes sp. NPDC051859]|uniref:FG-GAP-like repeat-containing protein n=1 Tax=Actinoplanes sp. NPDC051859 TaxID=3363909 RepID=UPI0037B4C5B7
MGRGRNGRAGNGGGARRWCALGLQAILVAASAAVTTGPAVAAAPPAASAVPAAVARAQAERATARPVAEPAVVSDPLPRESTAPAGAIEATHAVTDAGQSVYAVGIEVPPGLNGLAPELTLSASSGTKDGLLGEGWSLSGFSVIERCPLSAAQSGGYARPIDDPAGRPDGFCLDGKLLVSTSGSYGADGSEYRTEVDTFTRIVASRPGNEAAGPQGFEVRTRDGRILRYGFATDAVTSVDGLRRRWAVKEEQDRSGNYLETVYGRACTPPTTPQPPTCTRYAPTEVRYGGHRSPSGAVQAHDRAVKFTYENRQDGWSAFSRGMRDLEWRRLSRVETVVNGAVVRRWKVSYANRTDVSRLARLDECVDDAGGEVCKPPTTFTYHTAEGFPTGPTNGPDVPYLFGNGLGSDTAGRTIVLDANGDGRDDLIYPVPRKKYTCWAAMTHCDGDWEYQLAIASGNRSAPYSIIDLDLGSQQYLGDPFWCISQDAVLDYNGDGRDDLVSTCGVNTHGTVLVSTGQGFTTERIPVLSATEPAYPFWLSDLNGDSLADLLVCRNAQLLLHLNLGPRQGFAAGRTLPNYGHLGDSPLRSIQGGRGAEPCEAPLFLDSDGDGVANVLKRSWEYTDRPDNTTWVWTQTWKALSLDPAGARWVDTGLRFAERLSTIAPTGEDVYDSAPYWTGNVMNDDPSDDGGAVNVTTYARKWQLRVADVNGDGLDDIVRYDGDQQNPVRLHTNTGKGFGADSPILLGDAAWNWYRVSAYGFARAQFVDYDNDGRTDVLVPVGDPRQAAALKWVLHRVQDRSSLRPELLGTWNLNEHAQPIRADVDGDGSSDLVLATYVAGLKDRYGNPAGRLTFRWGAHATTNLLVTARDGLGESVLFDYAARDGDQQPVYRRTFTCRAAQSSCSNRMGPLVSSVMVRAAERDDGDIVPTERQRRISWQTFRYEDNRAGWYGRGNLGFARRITTSYGDLNSDLIETVTQNYDNSTYLDQVAGSSIRNWYPYAGRLISSETRSAPIAHGLGTAETVHRVLAAGPISHAVRLSAAGVPFVVQDSGTDRELMRTQQTNTERTVTSTETSSTFDNVGNVTGTDTLVRNAAGTVVERTVTQTTYDTSAARRGQWLNSLPLRQTDTHTRQGHTATRTTAYTHTADRGLGWTTTREPDEAAYTLVETNEHDEYGNVTAQTLSAPGEAPRSSRTTYDTRGLFPIRLVNPEGHAIGLLTDTALGRSLVEVDPNGIVHRSAYDGFGRVRRESGPIGDTVTTYARADTDTTGNERARLRTDTQIAGGARSVELQDALGRAIETREDGYAGTTVVTESTFDWADRPLTVARPHLVGDGSQGSSRYDYDALGRLITEERPDDDAPGGKAVTTLRYGWPDQAPGWAALADPVRAAATTATAVTDPLGRTTTQLDDHTEAVAASVSPDGAATQVEYAAFNLVRRVTGPDGAATTFDTDKLGRNSVVESAGTGRHGYAWTAFGQLRTHTDPRGFASQYTYDRLGRNIVRQDPRGTASWTYDGPGPNAVGRLVAAVSAQGHKTTLAYEPVPTSGPNRGLLASTEETIDGVGYRIAFGYDQYGRTSRIDYPTAAGKGFGVEHAYDSSGHLTAVRDSETKAPYWTFTTHSQGYRIGSATLGNGVVASTGYQPRSGRINALTAAAGTNSPVQSLTYGYDAAGNVQHVRDTVRPDRSRAYHYDAMNRVDRAQKLLGNNPATPGDTVEAFTYDRAGNTVNQSGVGDYGYGTPHAVVKAGANTYGYDAAGNQTTRQGPDVPGGATELSWTPANLPATATSTVNGTKVKTSFDYNAGEQRVVRRTPTEVTTYVADRYERRAAPNSNRAEHRYYVQAGGHTVAQVVRDEFDNRIATSTTTYEHPDRLGSALDYTTTAGAKKHTQTFSAYGENAEPDRAKTGERGFTGHQQDTDLGLIDTGGRLYDPVLGRFLSPDPVLTDVSDGSTAPQESLLGRIMTASASGTGEGPVMGAADANQPYAYAANNPLSYVDPDGRDWITYGKLQSARAAVRDSEVGHAVAGFMVGVTQGAAPGGAFATPVLSAYAPSRTFEFFRGAGEFCQAVCQLIGGGAGTIAGAGATATTGPGAAVAAPVTLASAAVAAEAVTDIGAAVWTMGRALLRESDDFSGGGESTHGAPQVTPPASAAPAAAPAPAMRMTGPPTLRTQKAVAKRAADLQKSVPENSRGRITMAYGVGKDAAGKTRKVVGTSEKNGYLRPGVKLKRGEEMAKGTGHAEENVLTHMRENGITPEWVAAGRPICRGRCAPAIEAAGARPASPVKAPPKPKRAPPPRAERKR